MDTTKDAADLRDRVRERYASAAIRILQPEPASTVCGCGCGAGGDATACCGGAETGAFGPALYDALERDALPQEAVLASLGCGNPTAVAELRPGESVLDLGSGGGIDVLLSARRVGPTGVAYGLDMTDQMLALAERNRAAAGLDNAIFLKGDIERIPLPAAAIDVVISNCVINLAVDKSRVFAEMARVLRPGGRIGISDVVAADGLTPAQRAERGSYVGCIAGALSFAEYRAGLERAGFSEVAIEPTHAVADGMFAAIIRAAAPSSSDGRKEVIA